MFYTYIETRAWVWTFLPAAWRNIFSLVNCAFQILCNQDTFLSGRNTTLQKRWMGTLKAFWSYMFCPKTVHAMGDNYYHESSRLPGSGFSSISFLFSSAFQGTSWSHLVQRGREGLAAPSLRRSGLLDFRPLPLYCLPLAYPYAL